MPTTPPPPTRCPPRVDWVEFNLRARLGCKGGLGGDYAFRRQTPNIQEEYGGRVEREMMGASMMQMNRCGLTAVEGMYAKKMKDYIEGWKTAVDSGYGLPKLIVSGPGDNGTPKGWDMMMAASATYIEWQKMCRDRTKVNLILMRLVRFADKANIVDKYGADTWCRILDCKGVRELNSASRHDANYPMICNLLRPEERGDA